MLYKGVSLHLLVLALLTGGLGLAGVDAKKQRKWNGTIKFLQKIARTAPCKSGRCAPLVNEMRDPKGPQERYVIRDLLADYDKLPRPVMKDSQNVTVHFAASLMELLNHAEATGRVGMRMIMRLWWKDPQLAWEPRQYAGVEKVSLPPNLIWTPDIGLYNGWISGTHIGSVGSSVNGDVKLTVYSNGDVLWMPPTEFQVTCTYQFRSDSWHCPLRFRSWAYDGTQLDIVPFKGITDIDKSELMYSAHWVVIENSGKRVLEKYPCCEEKYPTMEFMIGVRMKIGHPALGKRSIDMRPDY